MRAKKVTEKTDPTMTPEDGIRLLSEQLEKAKTHSQNANLSSPVYEAWRTTLHDIAKGAFGTPHDTVNSIISAGNCYAGMFGADPSEHEKIIERKKNVGRIVSLLESAIEQLNIRASLTARKTGAAVAVDHSEKIGRILSRFHKVARQLRDRHDDRDTLEVEDEYDVQDLLHALLKLEFEDIRPEEWTPSYAGGSSRVDFLLKAEQIIIEVKKTRQGLKDKDLGEQLIIDIARYEHHPDCKTLICFIYDPESRIGNPSALIRDLEQKSKPQMKVKVIICPVH